jgi:hypothetical protein
MRKSRAELHLVAAKIFWVQIFCHLVTKNKPNAASTKDFVFGWKNWPTFAIFQGKKKYKIKSEIVRFRQ